MGGRYKGQREGRKGGRARGEERKVEVGDKRARKDDCKKRACEEEWKTSGRLVTRM